MDSSSDAFGRLIETLAERYLAWASRRRNRGLFRVLQLASSEYLIRRVKARRNAS